MLLFIAKFTNLCKDYLENCIMKSYSCYEIYRGSRGWISTHKPTLPTLSYLTKNANIAKKATGLNQRYTKQLIYHVCRYRWLCLDYVFLLLCQGDQVILQGGHTEYPAYNSYVDAISLRIINFCTSSTKVSTI